METYKRKHVYQSENVAEAYSKKRFSHPKGKKENKETTLALESALDSISEAQSILDMPCGNGRFTDLFSEKGYLYFGADISMEMMRNLAKVKNGQERTTPLVQCDGEALPFKANTFDCVVCVRFLHHHMPDRVRENILREMRRVAKKWLIVQSQHVSSLGLSVILRTLMRKSFGRKVRKFWFHREIINAGWKQEKEVIESQPKRYFQIYHKKG